MKNYKYLQDAVANTVESYRKNRKMTKMALADFSGLRDCYIRDITKGQRNPTIGVIYSICEALDVSPVEFVGKLEEEREKIMKEASKTPDKQQTD